VGNLQKGVEGGKGGGKKVGVDNGVGLGGVGANPRATEKH